MNMKVKDIATGKYFSMTNKIEKVKEKNRKKGKNKGGKKK